MQNTLRIVVLLPLLAGFSCRKLISVPPPTEQLSTEEVFANDANAIAAQNNVYTDIMDNSRTLLDAGSSIYLSLSADDMTRVQPQNTDDAFALNALTGGNSACAALYRTAYATIRLANINLEQLPGATGITDSLRRQLMGEARVVRAILYFYLVNLWGDIPLVTTSDYTVSNTLPRTAAASVYQQIVTDLALAQQLLGTGYRTYPGQMAERTLPNQATATALLARVYLYQGNWSGAIQQASAVIGDSRYQLEKDLDRVFLSSSQEAIWQLQPLPPSFYTEEGATFIPLPGGRPTYILTGSLINAFEAGDGRKDRWTRSLTLQGKSYTFPNKYKANASSDSTTTVKEYTTLIRLAELYLVRAEALARLGDGTAALADLNSIRNRAGLPWLNNTDPAAVLVAIAHERQVEFFTEYGHRWLDLKRTGQVDAVLRPKKTGWQAYDTLYPFPAAELQHNPLLVQNSGY